jgi:hypothetical protein
MLSRFLTAGALIVQVVCAGLVFAQSRSIEGTYRNSALGYSIQIPSGLKGAAGGGDGPERGVRISLPSGSDIVVFGEPNSLEYKSPEDGVRADLELKGCESGQQEIQPSALGKIKAARGRLVCGDRVLNLFLAFRPQGGPIYWLRLETTRAHESEDELALDRVATSFKLIRWK